jgi:hypothetical protein
LDLKLDVARRGVGEGLARAFEGELDNGVHGAACGFGGKGYRGAAEYEKGVSIHFLNV